MGNQIDDKSQSSLKKDSLGINLVREDTINKNSEITDKNEISKGKYLIFDNVLGNGSFGEVVEALVIETKVRVAIKRVIQDPKYKNRELDIMKTLSHPNIVSLKDYFYTEQCSQGGELSRYLNVVMEHIPDNVFRVLKSFARNNQPMPIILVKIYTYQLCRSLAYLHGLGICHRDVKPQNLLVDSKTHVLKLCDFGSSKRLIPGESSVPYICSRFYRAPELILGAVEYTSAVDTWSIGCVFGELLLGIPLFAGDTNIDQLIKIVQILGTPTKQQLAALYPTFSEFEFPTIEFKDWHKIFGSHVPEDAIDLISQFLRYEPNKRLKPLEALAHPFFSELRKLKNKNSTVNSLPELFNFTDMEIHLMSTEARQILIPNTHNYTG